ncbi:MAG: transglutaminase-like putative cysteine protease [Glaciecola sp.]|jgi:transglutaminase-like putative cysteine protease
MKFKLVHETTYSFSEDVFLEPHYLRFRPKQTPFSDLIDFSIVLESEPDGCTVIEDEEHNVVDFCWFGNLTNKLRITAKSTVQTKEYNPFNFLIYPDSFNTIPFSYSEHQHQILFAALQKMKLSSELSDYAENVLKESASNTINFVSNITMQIHKDFTVEYRELGSPMSPSSCFSMKKGSCRDLSWMLIMMLRNYGIAARFVSGYFYFDMDHPTYELHAWVEVFIPGIGWLGIDPSHGILTGNTHFPVASSAIPENTMPVTGGIRGSATSQLTTKLKIEKY